MSAFSSREFLSDGVLARLVETRVSDPEYSFQVSQRRVRRKRLAPTGKLNILAADHPARRVTKVGDDALAMADRRDYLARILRVLTCGHVDGVMATMDILEDLLIIEGFLQEADSPSLLNGRLLIASLNRGGLAGTCWEMDDPVTAATPKTCQEWRLDGGKLLLRVEDNEAGSLKTMLACARVITESNALRLPVFLEPLPAVKGEKGYAVVKTRDALARLVGVASALGDSSRYLWLKLPYCEGYEAVARATTLPILLLGGESAGSAAPLLRMLESALTAGPNVRGALVGRNVLYSGEEDPFAVATAASGIVHQGWSAEAALQSLAENRGRDLDRLSRYLG